jgi:hypothetical protein
MPETRCPVCEHVNDRATTMDADPAPPTQHDFTVCMNCGCILIFDLCAHCGELDTRLPTPEEAFTLEDQHPEVTREIAQIQTAILRQIAETRPGYVPPWMNPEAFALATTRN